jgi:trehalose 6-phosphate synthase
MGRAGWLVTALTGLASSLPDAVWVCAATTDEDNVRLLERQ